MSAYCNKFRLGLAPAWIIIVLVGGNRGRLILSGGALQPYTGLMPRPCQPDSGLSGPGKALVRTVGRSGKPSCEYSPSRPTKSYSPDFSRNWGRSRRRLPSTRTRTHVIATVTSMCSRCAKKREKRRNKTKQTKTNTRKKTKTWPLSSCIHSSPSQEDGRRVWRGHARCGGPGMPPCPGGVEGGMGTGRAADLAHAPRHMHERQKLRTGERASGRKYPRSAS